MSKVNYDTVEEFWTCEHIQLAYERASQSSLGDFRADFGRYLGVAEDCLHLMPSGHLGLEWMLSAKHDPRRLVMVPAFNCSVVQDAITAAGCRSQAYDFSPRPGRFDWQKVIEEMNPSVGVLIVTHYFGVPIDFRPILEY